MGEQTAPPRDQHDPPATVRLVSTDKLAPGPFQPRTSFHPDSLSELVDSIRARGVLQPLLARPHPGIPDHFEIVAGERRWRAAQQAGLHEIPVLVRELSNIDAMAASLVENLQRQDLNPIEEAEGFRRLVEEFGLTQDQLGSAVGKSRSHVANAMRLLNLPSSVRQDVQNGRLSAGHARALLAHADPEAAAKIVIDRGLNVRQTESLSTLPRDSTTNKTNDTRDPETEGLERDLSDRLGLKVKLGFNGRGGTITIVYKNLEQLDGVVSLLSRD